MIAKALFTSNDYEKTVRFQTRLFSGMLFVGIVGLMCYLSLVKDSSLPDFSQGLYLGVSTGLMLAGLLGMGRLRRLKKDPEARRKAAIEATDEREQAVTQKAMNTASLIHFYLAIAAMLVLAPIDMTAFWVLFALMLLFCLTFVIARIWYGKKL